MVIVTSAAAALWIADDLPEAGCDEPPVQEGRFWSTGGGDETYPNVKRPIGFMRRKPRIRVQAWTMPIIPGDL